MSMMCAACFFILPRMDAISSSGGRLAENWTIWDSFSWEGFWGCSATDVFSEEKHSLIGTVVFSVGICGIYKPPNGGVFLWLAQGVLFGQSLRF